MTARGISILICTHNRAAILSRTLESLAQMDKPPSVSAEVLVIANACTDATVETALSWSPRLGLPIRVVTEPTPGLSVARNRAAREAAHPLLAFLDDDVWVARAWLNAMIDVYQTTPADMVAGHVELWYEAAPRPPWVTPGMEVVLSCLDMGRTTYECDAAHAIGANFSCTRDVFHRAGPFRPDLGRTGKGLMAGEETYFLRFAKASGFRMFYCPDASVKHWVPPSRLNADYLAKVSRSSAYTLTVLSDRFGPGTCLRAIASGLSRLALGSGQRLLGTLTSNSDRLNAGRVIAAMGGGKLAGVRRRLFDDSLVPERRVRKSAPIEPPPSVPAPNSR